jgi:hypothetical protein
MNCCDEYGECNQGRDCPVRVARVKSRTPRYPAPLRREISHVYLRHLAKWMLIAIAALLVSAVVVGVSHA